MEHIDITIDFETCALSANAAVIQLGAVAWDRLAGDQPLISTSSSKAETFNQRFDLTDQFFKGREFSENTQAFWQAQSPSLHSDILLLEPKYTHDVLYNFKNWVNDLMQSLQAKTLCLWSQGADFDIALLRNLCDMYDVNMPEVLYKNFRDSRSFIQEVGGRILLSDAIRAAQNPSEIYGALRDYYKKDFPPQSDTEGCPHDALYDAVRTTYNTWLVMRSLNNVVTASESVEASREHQEAVLEVSAPEY